MIIGALIQYVLKKILKDLKENIAAGSPIWYVHNVKIILFFLILL